MRTFLIVLLCCFSCKLVVGQKTLQILKVKLGSFKKYEVFSGDVLEYKLRGKYFYKRNLIANMNDSVILFQNDSSIKIGQIKAIKLHTGSHLMSTFSGAFFIAGVGYVTLNFINNLILESAFRIDPRALYVSGGFFAASFILRQLGIKRVHIRHNVSLKVLDLNFEKLR